MGRGIAGSTWPSAYSAQVDFARKRRRSLAAFQACAPTSGIPWWPSDACASRKLGPTGADRARRLGSLVHGRLPERGGKARWTWADGGERAWLTLVSIRRRSRWGMRELSRSGWREGYARLIRTAAVGEAICAIVRIRSSKHAVRARGDCTNGARKTTWLKRSCVSCARPRAQRRRIAAPIARGC